MNQKLNWARRGRANAARIAIPLQIGPDAVFEVKVKRSQRHTIVNLDPPLVQDLNHLPMRANERLKALLAPFNRRHLMAPVTLLDERHLDGRRLEAVLRVARKKRC
ncbi:MAG TPA: hypothetical protein VH280_24255 [Verrucomicrobiae bacterium]|nr:hypothetical protein [Verrucomicrobiae bacterium]